MTAFDPIKCGGSGKSVGNMELLILAKIGTTPQTSVTHGGTAGCFQQE